MAPGEALIGENVTMDLSDTALGVLAFVGWVVISIPVGVIVGMAVHLGSYDTDECPCLGPS